MVWDLKQRLSLERFRHPSGLAICSIAWNPKKNELAWAGERGEKKLIVRRSAFFYKKNFLPLNHIIPCTHAHIHTCTHAHILNAFFHGLQILPGGSQCGEVLCRRPRTLWHPQNPQHHCRCAREDMCGSGIRYFPQGVFWFREM